MQNLFFEPPILATQVLAITLAAVLAAALLYGRAEPRAGRRLRAFLAGLRVAVLLGIGFLLLNPSVIQSAPGSEGKARFFLLFDTSRSMSTPDVPGSAGARSRFAAGREAALGEPFLKEMGSLFDLSIYSFGAKPERTALGTLRALAKPAGDSTELGEALVAAASDAGQRGQRTAGALLISDGRDNGGTAPTAAARVARGAGLPVWTLCLGQKGSGKDVALFTYAVQSFAFARQRTTLTADIEEKGFGGATVAVSLLRNGVRVAEQALAFTGDGRRTVRFPVSEQSPGLYRYTLAAAPMAGEQNTRNNARTLFLRVINEKIRVLLLDARPSWDTKFLGQALRHDRDVDFTAIYRLSSARDFSVTTRAPEPRSGEKIKLPRRAEDLFAYDVVLLGKGFEELLTESGVDMLKRYLLERGGSVVFFRGRPDDGTDKLGDIEPVTWSGGEVRDLELALTEEGKGNPAFAFPNAEEPQAILRKLPRLISATEVKGTRSLAVVLAQGSPADGGSQPMATVAYQRYGAGRVMAIAAQGMWQWAFLPDEQSKYDAVFTAFWGQMLRWLVGGSDFLPGQDLSLKTDRLSYSPGQQAHLLVFAKRGGAGTSPQLEVVEPGGKRVPVAAGRSQAFGATFVGVYTPRQVGDYTVLLRSGGRAADSLQAAFTVYESQLEDLVTAADPDLMRQIAEASAGGVVSPETLAGLPRKVKETERRRLLQEQSIPQWDRPWVFFLLCALLATEWYARRRSGLS